MLVCFFFIHSIYRRPFARFGGYFTTGFHRVVVGDHITTHQVWPIFSRHMLRRSWLRCATRQNFSNSNSSLNPYAILGVSQGAPFEEIRRKFHELARMYHPDMPQGNALKFREINAAYRQLRTSHRTSQGGPFRQKPAEKSSADFWEARNAASQRRHQENERFYASQRDRYAQQEADRRRYGKRSNRSNPLREMWILFNGYEIVLSLFTVVVVLLYSVQRYFTARRMIVEHNLHLQRMDEGLPPPMPLKVDEEMRDKYKQPVDQRLANANSQRILKESEHRRVTQRRFEDFREFLFVHDPDGIASRKISTTRFSYQYVLEKDIPKRCPIVMDFDSSSPEQQFDSIAHELGQRIEKTPWTAPDAAVAGALVAKGLQCIPANSPSTAKWVFVEYRDLDAKESGRRSSTPAEPTCLFALRNHRFDDVGICQRITIAGSASIHPYLQTEREEDLASGTILKKNLVSGKPLPLINLNVPLERMKL